jgi:hypothetical protein
MAYARGKTILRLRGSGAVNRVLFTGVALELYAVQDGIADTPPGADTPPECQNGLTPRRTPVLGVVLASLRRVSMFIVNLIKPHQLCRN